MHFSLGLGFSWYQVVWSGDITLNYNAEEGKLGWFFSRTMLRRCEVAKESTLTKGFINGKAILEHFFGLFGMTNTEISPTGFQLQPGLPCVGEDG